MHRPLSLLCRMIVFSERKLRVSNPRVTSLAYRPDSRRRRTSMTNANANRSRFKRTLSLFISAIVIAVIFWTAGLFPTSWITWLAQRFEKPQEAASPIAITLSPKASAVESGSRVVPPAPTGNDSSISEKPLPLILTGTVPGRNSHEGQAFIGVNKESPQTYEAGALLANGARLAAIFSDHVALEKEGRSVELYLDGAGKHNDAKALESLLTVGGVPAAPAVVATTREVLTDYIRPSPVYDGEMLRGYQVYAGQNSGVFSQMGLQAGDIVTSINGVPLNEPQTAIEQLKQLTEGVAVTATIERKEDVQVLSLDGALIVKDQQRVQNVRNVPSVDMQ